MAARELRGRRAGRRLAASDHNRSASSHFEGPNEDLYALEATSKQGNKLVFNRATSRTAVYDTVSRRKVGERRRSEVTALGGIYGDKRHTDTARNASHAHTRILWKLWEREEKDGDVSVNAFPGFTYDSKTNGYAKTSFLWRFFRCETDPRAGTKVDLFFISVWR